MSDKNIKPTLPQKPDFIILGLLSRAKLLLSHALSHSNSYASIDRMIAIHGLDNCIEYILRIIIKHLDIEVITNKNLDSSELSSLAGEVNSFLFNYYQIRLPYYSDIKLIRQIRNLVQHAMVDPSPDLKRCSLITERFFDQILETIFGINKDEIRISTLIKNTIVKEHLKLAEENIDKENFLLSVVSSRDAFENAHYFQIINSSLKSSVIPALIEAKKQNEFISYFISTFSREFELIRLGIDLKRYRKFVDYLQSIPLKYKNQEYRGQLNRAWNKEDAYYCYNFATDVIVRWENEELEPVQTYVPDKKYDHKYKLGDFKFSTGKGSMVYLFKRDESMLSFYIEQDEDPNLKRLIPDNEYIFTKELYIDDVLDRTITQKVKLLNFICNFITHNPTRWEGAIWYTDIPFSYHFTKYENGIVVKQTPNINTATLDEIKNIHELISIELAKKIINLREAIGRIRSENDLKKIEGITEEQIRRISSNSWI